MPIVDELGFVPLGKTGAELLFELVSQRYERSSSLITGNLPLEEWTRDLRIRTPHWPSFAPPLTARIGRWKQVIGDRLQARDFDCQITEAKIASKALNRMTGLGHAVYQRVV